MVHNMRKMFGKSYTKCGEETIPKTFTKNSKLCTFLD